MTIALDHFATALDKFDTVNDLITKAVVALNTPVDDPPTLSPIHQLLADRIRDLVSANLVVTRILLHDHAEAIGLFKRTPATP